MSKLNVEDIAKLLRKITEICDNNNESSLSDVKHLKTNENEELNQVVSQLNQRLELDLDCVAVVEEVSYQSCTTEEHVTSIVIETIINPIRHILSRDVPEGLYLSIVSLVIRLSPLKRFPMEDILNAEMSRTKLDASAVATIIIRSHPFLNDTALNRICVWVSQYPQRWQLLSGDALLKFTSMLIDQLSNAEIDNALLGNVLQCLKILPNDETFSGNLLLTKPLLNQLRRSYRCLIRLLSFH